MALVPKTALSPALYLIPLVLLTPALADRFDDWDQNKDGKLVKSELPKSAQRNFAKADKDDDGYISREEHSTFVGRSRSNRRESKKETGNSPRKKPGTIEGIKITLDLPYLDTGNPKHRLDLLLPEGAKPESPLPVIVWIHGGAWRAGNKKSGHGRLAPFVQSGEFAAVSVAYRLSQEAKWPSQIEDCQAAIRWIKANAEEFHLDPKRIGVWGSSAGGHLVAMIGALSGSAPKRESAKSGGKQPDASVTCVVDFFGPTDFLRMNDHDSTMDHDAENSPESQLIGGKIQENKERSQKANPINYVNSRSSPMFIAHGDADKLVPHDQSVRLQKVLKKKRVPSIFVTMKGSGHGFHSEELNTRVGLFFARHLQNKEVEIEESAIEKNQ